jgi:hypothetical protein
MALTAAQLDLLATDIAADPTLSSLPHNADSATVVCAAYNQPDVPAFWVWRTSLPEQDIYEATTVDGTVWDWTTYIQQTVQERDAWACMFHPGVINPSLPQTRAGYTKIFSGSGALVVAQRTHLLTLSRRQATRAEALFATGAGTTAAPALLTFEGLLTESEVEQAWAQ